MRLLFCLLLCIVMTPVAALEITDDLFQRKVINLHDDALILQDPDHAFTPETAIKLMSAPDYQSDSLTPSVDHYWIYTPLTNHTQYEQWTIRSFNILFDKLDFYLYCKGQPAQYTPQPPLGFHSCQDLCDHRLYNHAKLQQARQVLRSLIQERSGQ